MILEDDYDSEFRFLGSPIPALQGLGSGTSVVFLGSFNKVLFPALRLGYLVVPDPLIEPLAALRFNVDRYSATVDQTILCDFICEGHLGRHIRRMRECYSSRAEALANLARRYLSGLLEIPPAEAGLHTAAFLRDIVPHEAVAVARAHQVEAMALDRFCLRRRDIRGLLLGFAAVGEQEIRRGVVQLAAALETVRRNRRA